VFTHFAVVPLELVPPLDVAAPPLLEPVVELPLVPEVEPPAGCPEKSAS
jgi:hypothetical protein